jgi:3-phosphoglycerate kinase
LAPRTAPKPRLRHHAPIACVAIQLLAAEMDAITALAHPKRPLVAIAAGSKVSPLNILRWPRTSTADRRRRHC